MTAVSFLFARLEKGINGFAMGLMTNKNPKAEMANRQSIGLA